MCSICNHEFAHKNDLKRHILVVHEEKKPHKKQKYGCNSCDKSFSTKSNLNKHVKEVHNVNQCLEQLKTKMQKYTNNSTTQKSMFIGEKIKVKIPTRKTILSVINYQSEKMEENYLPDIDKVKKEPIDVNLVSEDPLHIPSKNLEKTYKCSHCHDNFSTKPKLLVHVRSVHEGKGPFVCKISTNDFAQRSELKNHMKRHEKTKYVKQKTQSIREEFDTNIQRELSEKSSLDKLKDENQREFSLSEEKPKLTYAQLIAGALSNASEGMLLVSDIYKSISSSHPYYKLENTNWQNSIRYQLSINESFAKAEEGHGKYWMLSNNLQGKLKKSKYLKHLESTKNTQ